MSEISVESNQATGTPQQQTQPPSPGIVNQTLGDLLTSNTQAQGLIMKAMHINPEQLKQMVDSTKDNPMMNQTIGELFKNGTMQQAAVQGGQISPEQVQHIVNVLPTQEQPTAQTTPQQMLTQPSKPSFVQKLKNVFK